MDDNNWRTYIIIIIIIIFLILAYFIFFYYYFKEAWENCIDRIGELQNELDLCREFIHGDKYDPVTDNHIKDINKNINNY